MWLKDPAVVREQNFQNVAQQHNQREPQSCGKHDSTQHRLSLSRETITTGRQTPLKNTSVNKTFNNLNVFDSNIYLKIINVSNHYELQYI